MLVAVGVGERPGLQRVIEAGPGAFERRRGVFVDDAVQRGRNVQAMGQASPASWLLIKALTTPTLERPNQTET